MGTIIYNNPIIDDEECYVAFLDILGFKEMVKSKSPELIKKMLCDLVRKENLEKAAKAESLYSDNSSIDMFNRVHEKLYVCNISDSIVIAIDASDTSNLDFLLYLCYKIQWYFFMKYEMILRGAVSKGSFYGNSVVTIGKGLLQAFDLEEKEAKNPRIIIDRDLIHEFKEMFPDVEENSRDCKELRSDFSDYSLLLDPEDDYYYIRWLWNLDERNVFHLCSEKIVELKEKQSQEEKIIRKYQWIIDKITK